MPPVRERCPSPLKCNLLIPALMQFIILVRRRKPLEWASLASPTGPWGRGGPPSGPVLHGHRQTLFCLKKTSRITDYGFGFEIWGAFFHQYCSAGAGRRPSRSCIRPLAAFTVCLRLSLIQLGCLSSGCVYTLRQTVLSLPSKPCTLLVRILQNKGAVSVLRLS